jgi:curved DNA-binding protein
MAFEFKDYYAILGVPRTATEDEIKKAFRKLARQHHPDVSKDKKGSEDKFKEINEAYEVLGTPENRRKYDTLGADWKRGGATQPPPGWNPGGPGGPRRGAPGAGGDGNEFNFGGTGFSDFFERFFGQAGRQGRSGFDRYDSDDDAGVLHRRGTDVEGDLAVSLQEAVEGSIRSVSVRSTNPKTGAVDTETFKVRIPIGVKEGQRIRVAGKGAAGMGSGTSGDLILRVRLSPHPDFQVEDDDLFTEVPVAPWEAALGATITAPSLEGPVQLRMPPATASGQQLRVKKRGLPRIDAPGERGDLYVRMVVEMPPKLSDDEKAAWQALAAVSKFNPREE